MDHYYKYFRWLSLDIVLGAIFFLAYLERFFSVSLSWNVYFALGSAIWLIYTSDHLIDGRSVETPTSDRHRFHQQYFRPLVVLGGIVFAIALLNIYFLNEQIIKNGALLSAICISYLLAVYLVKKLWVKEVLVALVYAAGIFLAPITMAGFDPFAVFLAFQLFVIALLNLLVFSFYDFECDKKDGFNSLVIRLGKQNTNMLIYGLTIALFISIGCLSMIRQMEIQALYFTMATILLAVHVSPRFFRIHNRYRTVGDGVFYLPGLLLLL